ncbi:hypothetical protein CYMTET_4155 [Cymbomonas tetramitiformis]|uniref:Uncharacterized protein n=1 Tax=Cymbomonas tetramitiformis TaxID=36881 RepID=A0AAE0H1P0_9CHLO|nr:hypothetical protein CYMTET_4155 [Cymbomonas tetramitiformis]
MNKIENFVKVMRHGGPPAVPPKRNRPGLSRFRAGASPDPVVGFDEENKKALQRYGAPAVVTAVGAHGDVDVSAYGFHVEDDSNVGDDDASVPHPTEAAAAVRDVMGPAALAARPAGQVVPSAGSIGGWRSSTGLQNGVRTAGGRSAGFGGMSINNDGNFVTEDPVMCIAGGTCIYSGVDSLSPETRQQVLQLFAAAGGAGAAAAARLVVHIVV